jgi:hypothetical protein
MVNFAAIVGLVSRAVMFIFGLSLALVGADYIFGTATAKWFPLQKDFQENFYEESVVAWKAVVPFMGSAYFTVGMIIILASVLSRWLETAMIFVTLALGFNLTMVLARAHGDQHEYRKGAAKDASIRQSVEIVVFLACAVGIVLGRSAPTPLEWLLQGAVGTYRKAAQRASQDLTTAAAEEEGANLPKCNCSRSAAITV